MAQAPDVAMILYSRYLAVYTWELSMAAELLQGELTKPVRSEELIMVLVHSYNQRNLIAGSEWGAAEQFATAYAVAQAAAGRPPMTIEDFRDLTKGLLRPVEVATETAERKTEARERSVWHEHLRTTRRKKRRKIFAGLRRKCSACLNRVERFFWRKK